MNETKELNLDELSLFCIIRDLVRNVWVILLAAAAAWLTVTGVESLIYVQ